MSELIIILILSTLLKLNILPVMKKFKKCKKVGIKKSKETRWDEYDNSKLQ